MKTKKFRKKLLLNKKTIANMNNNEMLSVKGGLPNTDYTFCTCTWCTACGETVPYSCHSNGVTLCTQDGDCTYYC
jgi:hypothetical protein